MSQWKHYILPVATLFILSVIVRLPTLDRPLSKHHEFCTAIALRIMQVWAAGGIHNYCFNPAMNYPGAANRGINNFASASGKMKDAAGNYYYVSHPPLAYYFPFFVFRLLGIKPDVWAMESFNLLTHFLCAVTLAGIVFLLTSGPIADSQPAVVMAAVAYLFSPGPLWFHSNVYMADTLVQLFFTTGLFAALKYYITGKSRWILFYGCFQFLMVFSSWLGVFAAISVPVGALISERCRRKHLFAKIAAIALLSTFSALALTIFQYSGIAGFSALLEEWQCRLEVRSGLSAFPPSLSRLASGSATCILNYLAAYLPVLLAIFLLVIFRKKQLSALIRLPTFVFFFLSSVIPVALLHLVLSNYAGHDFTTLYAGLFLSVFLGIGMALHNERKKLLAGAVLLVICGTGQYYFINRPGALSRTGEPYAIHKTIGERISQVAAPHEVIFILKNPNGIPIMPETIFYAGRNIQTCKSESEARAFLRQTDNLQGVLLEITAQGEVVEKGRLSM
ncbi:MAG: hypothetical protein KatS3mg031_2481 [Chitinophagales bacterium]|nr:MAG: hypothetical protein KatS3mg031_2481 [Chitinophagales bacterium]